MSFLEEYLKKPSIVWKNAKIAVQIKLQWFQFPQGLTFQNKLFGTKEMSMFFKVKDVISDDKSAMVDSSMVFMNQILNELVYLREILA